MRLLRSWPSGGSSRIPRQAGPTTTTSGPWRPGGRCRQVLLRRGRRRIRKGGGGRDARLRGPYSTALPDGGKRVLVADTALWGRIALSPSPWYGACVFIAVATPSAPCSVVYSSSTLAVVCPKLVLLIFISRSVPFFCRLAHDARHHGRYGPKK